ncbi:MAG: GNAT family N-acetyltransferase, partial [Pseudomonadota bacterium]
MTNEPYTFLDPQDEKNLSLDTDRMKVGAFEAHLTPLSAADVKQLHELSVNVFWPHRDRDLALFLEVGSGYMARDQIGRPLGSAMYFPCGDDFAMIGMMMTAPRLQSRGTGRWLLHHVMRDCAARDLRLSATRSGYWLYESSGFLPVATIRRHQGIVRSVYRPDKIAGVTLRRGTLVDKAAIAALDRIGFGADRQTILDRLWEKSTSVVAKRAGSIVGYAFFRNFGRGTVIGPVVADSDE